jgi:anti-anti-sigma factor
VADGDIKADVVSMEGGITKVVLAGRMDVKGALAVDGTFSTVAQHKDKIIIDLSGVSFLASLGIRTLISTCKTVADKGGDMVLLNPQPNVEKVLTSSGVDTVITIVHGLDEAKKILNS